MNSPDIKTRVVNKVKQFYRKNRRRPSLLYLTLHEENELANLPVKILGLRLADRIAVNGVRQALDGQLLGMKIIWDSTEFKVE